MMLPLGTTPRGWHLVEVRGDGVAARRQHLRVIVSQAVEEDGRLWRHVSVSRQDGRLPARVDLAAVKRSWIGDDMECYEVWPTADRYVNLHRAVLHLWACLDADHGRVLPDFTRGGGSI